MGDPPPPMYVGYLPTPKRHRRLVAVLVPALVLGSAAIAGAIATAQRNPGPAVWDTAQERTWTGTLHTDPYPMLVDDDGHAHLVVGTGKFGVQDRLAQHNGARLQLRGFALQRDDRRLIELADAGDAVTVLRRSLTDVDPLNATPPVRVVVAAEIVDGKCYLGAMKPGDGKAHKACAILCLRGGLPPLVVADLPGLDGRFPLLRVDGSTDLPDSVLRLVGEPVTIVGELSVLAGQPIIDAAPAGVTRR